MVPPLNVRVELEESTGQSQHVVPRALRRDYSPKLHSVACLREPVALPGPRFVMSCLVAVVGEIGKLAKRDKRDTVSEVFVETDWSVAEPVPVTKKARKIGQQGGLREVEGMWLKRRARQSGESGGPLS